MPTSFSSFIQYSISVLCFVFLFGCQQPPEPELANEPAVQKKLNNDNIDLNSLCEKIEQNMAEIDDQRTTFALEQINQDLKVCLPLLTHAQQRHLMQHAIDMYAKFLSVKRDSAQQQAFEQYALDMAQHPTIQQSHFEQLTLRDQYLLKHKGQAYVEVVETSSGALDYRRSPEYLARIFAPYLPEAERHFIENLAVQNTNPIFRDQRLLIEPAEIAARALLWQDYVQHYPQGRYSQDAAFLLQQYEIFLFKGLPDRPVSESYAGRSSIQASSLEQIVQLSEANRAELSQKSKRFLKFIDLSEQQKQEVLPKSAQKLSPSQQLDLYLNLKTASSYSKDCFSDSICNAK